MGRVSYEDFCSSTKSTITRDEYEQPLKLFKENDCTTMGDWLRVYNVADVVPFIEAFRKMAGQYYPDQIDVCKDTVSIPGISKTYVLSKSLQKTKGLTYFHPEVFVKLQHCSCKGALKCGPYCEECQLDMQALERCSCEKAAVQELLRTFMVGGPVEVFTRYHKKEITSIRSHVYRGKGKLTKGTIGYDANALYLCCSSDVMPCGKDTQVVHAV